MKVCKKRNCENEAIGRMAYCSDSCKYWEGQMRREDNRGKPPLRKRNRNYFYKYAGASLGGSGAGRRSNGMVRGAMSSVLVVDFIVSEYNAKNVMEHISQSKNHNLRFIRLCDESNIGLDQCISDLRINQL